MRPYESRISGASAEVSRNRNAAWPFGVAMLGMFVPVLIAIASDVELLARDRALQQRGLHFRDVDRGDEHVVADSRERGVGEIEHRRLRAPFQLQHCTDDRLEQMLVVQHRDDREEHDQQRRERQRRLERLAQALLLGDTGERGRQHDHQQADDADLGDVQTERERPG